MEELAVLNIKCKIIKTSKMKKQILIEYIAFAVMSLSFVSVNAQEYCFSSYHYYTNDDDKYLTTNVQNDNSKVCVDEVNKEIELSLYNREAGKWMTFPLAISYKVDIAVKTKIGTLYMCTNNTNQTCGVCIVNTEEGLLIDLHNFYGGEKSLSCWVKSEKN